MDAGDPAGEHQAGIATNAAIKAFYLVAKGGIEPPTQGCRAVWKKAHFTVQDAMDSALLTGWHPADVLKFKRVDIRDGALWVTQNKTSQKLRIIVEGELAALIERMQNRSRKAVGLFLIQNEKGQALRYTALRSRFDKARRLASVNFQFRDIRAKAASDTGDLGHSQKLLGHKHRDMTEQYVRARIGERVKPLK